MAKRYTTALVVSGDAEGGIKAVKATGEELAKFDRHQKSTARNSLRMSRNMATARTAARSLALGVGAAAVGVLAITNRSIAAVKETDNLAKSLGVSVGTLQEWQYAGERVGISAEKMGDVFKDTQDKLGDFIATGGGEAADIFKNLNVSVDELRKLKPEQQLLRIGKAISEVNDRSQQVFYLESIADDASRLLPLLDNNAAALKKFAKEARDFNIALSDEDVERLLSAKRATARFSGAMRGLGNDIAVAVAPALTDSIDNMDYLRDIVGDSGFQQNLATLASAFAKTAGFLAEGSREYVTFGQQIGTAAAHLAGYSNELEDIDAKITRLQSMRGSSSLSRAGLFNFAGEFDTYIDDNDIDRYVAKLKAQRAKIAGAFSSSAGAAAQPAVLDPIEVKPGRFDKLTDKYDKAHAKLQQLREDRIKLQQAIADDPANADAYRRSLAEVNRQMDGLAQGSRSAAKALTSQQRAAKQLASQYASTVSTLDQQIALFGETGQTAQTRYDIERGALAGLSEARKTNLLQMSAEIDRLNAQKTAVQSLFPEFERLNQASQLRASVTDLPPELQAFGKRRAAQLAGEAATEGLPGMQGLDPQFNGPFGEANRLEGEKADYQQKYEARLEAFRAYAQQHKDEKATADQAIEALEASHQKRLQQYEDQTAKARRVGYQSLYGDLTSIVGSFAGQQSSIYQSMFAVSKAFAIADSIVSIQQGIAKALTLPFPANIAAGAAVAAQAVNVISTIEGTSLDLSGQAHDGIDNVPNSGTWNLESGERVVDRRTNVDLKQYLQRENTGTAQQKGGDVVYAPQITVEAKSGTSDEDARRQGHQIQRGLQDGFKSFVINEMRPGGLFENVKRTG